MRNRIEKLHLPWPDMLAAVGAIVYFLQSRLYASTQLSVLDEGAYLLKGLWFATGQYTPYQEFGPFTNHMPLAFLIPGYIQAWFSPGLASARAFAFALGMLFILGWWLLARRWGGPIWAALAIWAVALNPALIKIYSVGVTQGLIIAMLVWTFYFALGSERAHWQIFIGVMLSALMALTRLNMTPVLFLLLLYIYWAHGRKLAIKATAVGLGLWLLGHAVYWPGILQMWANYTPQALTPFLDAWRVPLEALPSWTSGADLRGRILSLLETLRFHFVPLLAALTAWLLWPKRAEWKSPGNYRAAYFISVLFGLLLLMHAVASLGADYCVFCFPLYTAFFSVLGILLLMLVWSNIGADLAWPKQIILNAAVFVAPMLVALGTYFSAPRSFIPRQWVRKLLNAEVPRVSGWPFQSGTLPLWGLLENRFGNSYEDSYQLVEQYLGLAIFGGFALLISLLVFWLAKRDAFNWPPSMNMPPLRAMLLLMLVGVILSPTVLLGGGYQTYDCEENIIQAYEELGAELAEIVNPGDLIFWRGGRSAVPLLYLEGVHTFPPQLNGDYTYRLGGEAQQLVRAGLWGSALLDEWLQQADVILVERDLLRSWLQDAIRSGPYEYKGETQALSDCSQRSEILIYEYAP